MFSYTYNLKVVGASKMFLLAVSKIILAAVAKASSMFFFFLWVSGILDKTKTNQIDLCFVRVSCFDISNAQD